ncbi:bZIP transcription factor 44-like [Hibiscus syriacus]|uniref:bZIP transcription factor 44-like n=1 Tax=Hibiscus syriacus TaxID=106335 RepID=UPI001924DB32|nr:bZIP transcription factor 44-like [Hibiscus syriacus]
MASSSGNSNSTGSSQLQNSGSVVELNQMNMMDQRKRKRKESNRESARRSRIRKQQYLDELTAQVTQLSQDNNQILTSINFNTHHYMNIQAENSVLRARMMELSQRLDSLNRILSSLNTPTAICGDLVYETDQCFGNHGFNDPFNLPYLNQAIMASPDIFQYY